MKQKSLVVVLMFGMLLLMYLYQTIYASSVLYEDARILLSKEKHSIDFEGRLIRPNKEESFFYDTYIQSPLNLELYIRIALLKSESDKSNVVKFYNRLLKTRPTWPYYYSGIAHIKQFSKVIDSINIEKAIRFGRFENQVVDKLTNLLFYRWDLMSEKDKSVILKLLEAQSGSKINAIVNISAKYAKIYEYCDFIFEKKHVEYRACTEKHWQPLLR